MRRISLFFLFCGIVSHPLFSQDIIGFWAAEEVLVGDQHLTPVAKWTKIYAHGVFESGKGWLQNSHGQWTYDEEKQLFSADDPKAIIEDYGPFRVSFTEKKMIWQREEDGIPVRVTWQPIKEMPKGPADQLTGLWQLITDEKPQSAFLFLRWDREFRARDNQGQRSRGYWQIHGHRPELRLIQEGKRIQLEKWKVQLEQEFLYLEGISDSNQGQRQVFRRSRTFPEE